MNTINETSYLLGKQSAYVAILQECLLHLPAGYTLDVQTWNSERQESITRLRSLCVQLNIDDDWSDNLYLPDIIEKLENYVLTHESQRSKNDT